MKQTTFLLIFVLLNLFLGCSQHQGVVELDLISLKSQGVQLLDVQLYSSGGELDCTNYSKESHKEELKRLFVAEVSIRTEAGHETASLAPNTFAGDKASDKYFMLVRALEQKGDTKVTTKTTCVGFTLAPGKTTLVTFDRNSWTVH